MKQPSLLQKEVLVGGALRIGPTQNGQLAARLWKFWTSGNEVYATARSNRGVSKISVHQSGQIHMRMEGKDMLVFAPPMDLGDWLHAFELGFLISADAFRPKEETIKGKRAFAVETPPNAVLLLNLLVGRPGMSGVPDLPSQFLPAAKPIWRATLSDRRPVVLIGRMKVMNDEDKEYLNYIRHELNPKVNFKGADPRNPYIEIMNACWSEKGGNVIRVIPMGKEGYRVHDSPIHVAAVAGEARSFTISNQSGSSPIFAPNGAIVGTFSIAGTTTEIALKTNVEVRGLLGTVALSMDASNLISGESFTTPTYSCRWMPCVGGGQPQNWDYRVKFAFDGNSLKATLVKSSIAFRNANLRAPVKGLGADEEIVVCAPTEVLVLQASNFAPTISLQLEGGFVLRGA